MRRALEIAEHGRSGGDAVALDLEGRRLTAARRADQSGGEAVLIDLAEAPSLKHGQGCCSRTARCCGSRRCPSR
jgi:hypothetical protein